MAEGTELAVIPKIPRAHRGDYLRRPGKQDRTRWFLFKRHIPIEEIAKRHGVSVTAIQQSISRMEAYDAQTSNDIVKMRYNEMLLNLADKQEKAVASALSAETVIRRPNEKNPSRMVVVSRDPDHKTRLEAARVLKEIHEAQQPKGGGVNIAVQQNQGTVPESSRAINFEERLRLARKRRGLSNTENLQQTAYEDYDESADDETAQDDDASDEETSNE